MLINVKQNSEMIYSEPDPSVIPKTAELYATMELAARWSETFSAPVFHPGEARTLTVPTNA